MPEITAGGQLWHATTMMRKAVGVSEMLRILSRSTCLDHFHSFSTSRLRKIREYIVSCWGSPNLTFKWSLVQYMALKGLGNRVTVRSKKMGHRWKPTMLKFGKPSLHIIYTNSNMALAVMSQSPKKPRFPPIIWSFQVSWVSTHLPMWLEVTLW